MSSETETFYIKHYSSAKYIHPMGGQHFGESVRVVLHDGKADYCKFKFEWAAGPWGYIVHADNPAFCVQPIKGRTNPENNCEVVLHTGRHLGCLFRFKQKDRIITHIGGRNWRPGGGDGRPDENTGIVLSEGDGSETQFQTVIHGAALAKDKEMEWQQPATVSSDWGLVFAYDHVESDRTETRTVKVGRSNTRITSSGIDVTNAAGIADELFGVNSHASREVKQTFSQTNAETWDEEAEVSKKWELKTGQPLAVWQYRFVARYDDGTIFNYGSGNRFCETRSARIPPPQ